jgi:hypothetical protein
MRKIISFLAICIFSNFYLSASAQNLIKSFKPLGKSKQYEKAEWDITINTLFENPYLQEDVSLDMDLTSPTGKKLSLPCYYESGVSGADSKWKARFMPQEFGTYKFVLRLNKAGKEVNASKQTAFAVAKTLGKGILHKKSDWAFQFDNGEAFRGIGENICWESRADDDSKFFKNLHEKEKYNYEYMLPALAKHGGNYFRTWICSWNLPLDWKSGINNNRYQNSSAYFNPSAIKKMDRLVNLSDSLGLYIMLTLGPGSYDARNGRYVVSTADFFTDSKAKAQYRNRLRFIVARWGYSSAIGAWEFFNEIDNVQFRDKNNPIPAENIVEWHQEMASYLKKIDPYEHLVTTSISHRDLKGLNSIDDIDFNQKHIYKNNRALPTTIISYANNFKKPYVIGEYGYEYDWSKDFNLFADEMDSDFKRGLWYGLFSPTPVLPMSWWWEFFDNRGTDAYISRVRFIQDAMMKAGRGNFEKIDAKVSEEGVEVFSVKCGDQIYIYVYNPQNKVAKTTITLPSNGAKTLTKYSCETGKTETVKNLKISENMAAIQDVELTAQTDFVFILK